MIFLDASILAQLKKSIDCGLISLNHYMQADSAF